MPIEKGKCQLMFEAQTRELINRGLGTDFNLLLKEQIILRKFGFVPMNHLPQESAEQFDRLTKFGIKLNLITGKYEANSTIKN